MTAAITKTANGTNLLAKVEAPSPLAAIAPRNLDDVFRLAQVAAKSGLYGVKSQEDAFIRMATGMELGLSAIQSLRGIWVLNGKPSLGAELMVALCLQHPECEAFELVESTKERATWRTVRRGKETKLSWTLEQAKAAGLAGKDVWKAYGETMLRWRAAAALAKTVYPEKMMGLLSVEEAAHIGPNAPPIVVDSDVVRVDDTAPVPAAPPSAPIADDTIEVAAEIEMKLKNASTMDERDTAVKFLVKAAKEQRITKHQFDVLQKLAVSRKKELEGDDAPPVGE